jgi:hypothetical protein
LFQAAHPKGEIYLGKSRDGYSVKRADDARGGGGREHGFVFRLSTPDRTYQLSAETAYDRDLWMDTLASLLETTPTHYDTDGNYVFLLISLPALDYYIQYREKKKKRKRGDAQCLIISVI